MLQTPWRIELFAGLTARQGDHAITRFRTQKTAVLLGLLALKPGLARSREVVVDMLWPDADPASGRLSLRVSLTSLRHQLEPPGVVRGSVLDSDYGSVRLRADAVTTDLAEFERHVADARLARDDRTRIGHLEQAVGLYTGPLLSGLYEDWVIAESARVAEAHRAVLSELIGLLRGSGEVRRAIELAQQLASLDPLSEACQRQLIELYALVGEPQRGSHHYERFAARLRAETGESPSEALAQLVATQPDAASAHPATPNRPPHPRRETAFLHGPPSHPDAPDVPARRHEARLPLPFTRFFGRQHESGVVESLLAPDEAGRLVTITGPGGIGKTRLALEAGRRWHLAGHGSVWFVPLADVLNAGDVPTTLSAAVGMSHRTDDPLGCIAERLSAEPALLILDNLEHIVDGAAPLVRALLERVPTARCLVTSRRRLNLEGERELPLQPLPAPSAPGTPERLAEFDSVQLFLDRAQAMRPDFQVTPRNADSIAALCYRLEGIPLALELAAGWVQALTPAQMVQRLSRRFELLVSRRRDAAPRHQTLQAAIEWSYNQLEGDLQRVLRLLSVFRGGFTIPAVAAVCDLTEADALSAFADLQERSLLYADAVEDEEQEMRGRMLETIREYASDRLTSEERAASLLRFGRFFGKLAERAREGLRTADQARWLKRVEREYENFRIALDAAFAKADDAHEAMDAAWRVLGLQLAADLWRAFYHCGHAREARAYLLRAIAVAPNEPSVARARALLGAGALALFAHDCDEADALASESLAMRRKIGDRDGEAEALNTLSAIANIRGDLQHAVQLGEEALAIRRELGVSWAVANSLGHLAIYAESLGDRARARTLYEQALTIQADAGDLAGRCNSLLNLAGMAYLERSYTEAAIRYEEVIEIAGRNGLAANRANALKGCAETWRERGDYAKSETMLLESLAIFRNLGDRFGAGVCLRNLSTAALCNGCPARAYTYASESLELFTILKSDDEIALTLHSLAMIAEHAGEHDTAAAHARRALEIADARRDGRPVARSIELLCALAIGRVETASLQSLLAAVDSWRQRTANYRQPSLVGPYERASRHLGRIGNPEASTETEASEPATILADAAALARALPL